MDNTRLRHLLILAATSLLIAVGFFYLGGVIAEAASAEPILGVTFKAGGGLAGFIISFILLFQAYKSLGGSALLLKVTVTPQNGTFTRAGNNFRAKTTILKRASGIKREVNSDAIWEAGGLSVHIRDLEEDDMVMIVLTDGNAGQWESDFFSPLCPSISLV